MQMIGSAEWKLAIRQTAKWIGEPTQKRSQQATTGAAAIVAATDEEFQWAFRPFHGSGGWPVGWRNRNPKHDGPSRRRRWENRCVVRGVPASWPCFIRGYSGRCPRLKPPPRWPRPSSVAGDWLWRLPWAVCTHRHTLGHRSEEGAGEHLCPLSASAACCDVLSGSTSRQVQLVSVSGRFQGISEWAPRPERILLNRP